jgi:hypothetical protein
VSPLDGSLQVGAHDLQERRQDILTELAGLRRQKAMAIRRQGFDKILDHRTQAADNLMLSTP